MQERPAPVPLEKGSDEVIYDFINGLSSDIASAPNVQGLELRDYARKIDENGVVLVSRSEAGQIEGLIAFYCNDLETRRAHIAYCAVVKSGRGSGITRALLDALSAHCTSVGMRSVTAESWRGKPWVSFLVRWARARHHAIDVLEDGVSSAGARVEIFFNRG